MSTEEQKYELWSKYALAMESVGETVEVSYVQFCEGIELMEEV